MIPTKNDNNKIRQGNKERKQMDTPQRDRHADRRKTDRQAGKQADRQAGRQAETGNSNSKTLFYKGCSLGSVKNLSNN